MRQRIPSEITHLSGHQEEAIRARSIGSPSCAVVEEPQPVASRLGPRFYDWQLAQDQEESWRECHLHARNLLGEAGYQKLLADIEPGDAEPPATAEADSAEPDGPEPQGTLFE